MNRLCTICARGGSKGVKNKNIRDLLGRPLIAYSILQAKETGLFSAIAVSSDSNGILDVAKSWGVDYLIKRPDELATDRAPKIPVIEHCVLKAESQSKMKFNVIVDLDATSPLRLPSDICEAVRMLEEEDASNVITGMSSRRSPYFNLVEVDDQGKVSLSKSLPNPVIRRQDSPKCYDMNASIYVWKRDILFQNNTVFNEKTALYVMPEERSIDIDTELDFAFVEFMMRKRGEKNRE